MASVRRASAADRCTTASCSALPDASAPGVAQLSTPYTLPSRAPDADVKLIDFGLAAQWSPPHMRMLAEVGTASYTAPEPRPR